MNDLKLIKEGLKAIHKLQPWVLPVTVLDSILKAIHPFVNIYMSAKIIDELIYSGNLDRLIPLVGITIGLNLIIHLLSTGSGHMSTILRDIMMQNQEMELNKKIIEMDYEHVENEKTHLLRAKIQEAELQGGGGIYSLIFYFALFLRALVTLPLSLILIMEIFKLSTAMNSVAGILNSRIFNIMFVLMLALGTIYNLKLKENANRKIFNSFNKIIEFNKMGLFYYDHIIDYNTGKGIRLYNQGKLIKDAFKKITGGFFTMFEEIDRNNVKHGAINGFISAVLSSLVYIFAGLKALAGQISIGNIMKYTGSINQFMDNSSILLISAMYLKTNNQYLQFYLDFLNIEGEKYNGTIPVEKRDDNEYEIEFRNVSFKYPGTNEYVLKNISIKLRIGQRLAIVGMNGSGKTTFIKLLCRLYDPDEGQILLNGIDIRKYDYDEYLGLFSIVFQDFNLFSFSLGQNVAAAVDFDEARVKKALEEVGFRERLDNMPLDSATPLYKDFDEEGVEISGGEAQKIALARALYKDAPIIILDEPTAALDPIAEFEIYSRFNEIVGNKTTVYISHRLSSCRFCDEIAVFHEGRIVQKGTHEELLRDKEGKYYELWHAQAQYYNEEITA